MAEPVQFELKSFSGTIPFDEPITIRGTIRYINKGHGCWAIVADDDTPIPVPPMPLQLEGLNPELQRDGLRVELITHIEDEIVGDCIQYMLFFVDEAAAL